MKKFLFLILCAIAAILALFFYKQHLDDTYFPSEVTSSVVEVSTIIAEQTTVAETTSVVQTVVETVPVVETTAAISETTAVTAETTTIIEESTTAAETITSAAPKDETVVAPPQFAGNINSLLEALYIDYPENALAVLINAPDEETLNAAEGYGRFTSSQGEPPSLIIPVYVGSTLTVNEIAGITNEGEFIYGERLVTDPDIEDKYSLLFEAIRPEGIPSYAVEITYEDKTALYPYAYDGRDGNEGIEYITITENIEALG